MIFCPEQLILDHEICLTANELMKGFDFERSDLALDVIQQVGPRNNFLTEEHTLNHFRDFHLSPLLNRKHRDGSPVDPSRLAMEEFKRLDATHAPEPLANEIVNELDRIVTAADREIEK
jgi:trimethylamine--corrinoid protein Co-methyltransferase